jgi:biopolymer transport protein ExbB/biopolymer transport protein TolQ
MFCWCLCTARRASPSGMASNQQFFAHTWQHASPLVLLCLILLFAMAFWTTADHAYRGFKCVWTRRQSRRFINLCESLLRRDAREEAIELAQNFKCSPAGMVCLAGLQIKSSGEDSRDAATRAARLARNQIHAQMKRGLSGIATISTTAPLIGLFGTCVGILDSFRAYIGSHSCYISIIAGNIADALVPTAAGLLAGVMATWSFNLRTDCLSACDADMEIVCLWLIEFSEAKISAKGLTDGLNGN